MAITTLEQIFAATRQMRIINKTTSLPSVSTVAPTSYWTAGSVPAAGSVGSDTTNFTSRTVSTTGAMAYDNPASGTLYLTGITVYATVAGVLHLFDRLADTGPITPATTYGSWTGSYTATRPSDGTECEIWAEITTALSAASHTLTVTYKDASDTSRTGTIVLPASAPVNRMYPMAQYPSRGVKQITALSGSGTPTGAFALLFLRRLVSIALPTASTPMQLSWDQTGAPVIYNDSCIFAAYHVAVGTSSPLVIVYPEFRAG